MQHFNSNLLALDAKWLSFSAIPLLIAIFLGGYVKSFKGFGIEVEANLEQPISKNYNIITTLEPKDVPKYVKGRISELDKLTQSQLLKIKRLTFIYGKRNYYGEEAIREYVRKLPNLEFIEIIDDKRRFQFLLSAQILRQDGDNMYYENIQSFISALESKSIPLMYPNMYESKYIKSDEAIIDVYKKLKVSYLKTIPIVNKNNEMIGLVDYYSVAIQIADEIVDVKNKKRS